MRDAADRQAALEVWLRSGCHRLSGLSSDEVRALIENECHNAGDFLRLIMEAMVRRQGVTRWAETTPAHLLHLPEIAATIPGALFIHVIRDGRDVAASLGKQRWIRPFGYDRERPALAAAAYWRWIVQRGRQDGSVLGANYLEVRYESLMEDPVKELRRIGEFIDHDLDWERIQRVGIGSVANPNTSFPGATSSFKGRWKTELAANDARDVDAMLADLLAELAYEPVARSVPPVLAARSTAYALRFTLREWAKRHTPLGRRRTDLSMYDPDAMAVTADKLAGVDGELAP